MRKDVEPIYKLVSVEITMLMHRIGSQNRKTQSRTGIGHVSKTWSEYENILMSLTRKSNSIKEKFVV